MMTRNLFKLVFPTIFALILLAGEASGENSYRLPDRVQPSRESLQSLHDRMSHLGREDQEARQRIVRTIRLYRGARSKNERDYFRMEYVEARAAQVGGVAVNIIGLLREQDRFLDQGRRAGLSHRQMAESPQLRGMQDTLVMIITVEEEARRTPPVGRRTEENLADLAREEALTYVLANLLSPPAVSTAAFAPRVKKIKTRLYGDLEGLRQEVEYLRRQLAEI
jgi:hypothetical protein